MSSSISNKRLTCKLCTENALSQPAEPLQITPFPNWQFQKLCTNYFTINQYSYLVVADRYSGWISVYYFKPGETNTSTLIEIFQRMFMDFGAADEISSNGTPHFKAEAFKAFLGNWGVNYRKLSVDYAQSNGRAEVT